MDTIRGLLLVIMTINHVHGALLHSGWIQKLTVSPLGFVSSAEGFIFISGYAIGFIYSRFLSQIWKFFKKIFSRCKTIYLYHLLPLFGLHLIALIAPSRSYFWERDLSFYYFSKHTLVAEASLLYQPELFDILPIYIIFVLMTPPLMLLANKRRGWVIVLFLSIGLWFFGQQYDPLCSLSKSFFPGHRCGWFNILVWQVPYTLGLIMGLFKSQLSQVRFFKSFLFLFVVFSATIFLFMLRHQVIDLGTISASSVAKHNLGWLRIVNLGFLIAFMGIIISKLPIDAHIPGVVMLGQHSLQVFTFQVLVIYFISLIPEIIVANLNTWTYPFFMFLISTSLLVPAYIHQKWQMLHPKMLKLISSLGFSDKVT